VLPVKDDIPTDRVPLVTIALIAANVVVFLLGGGAAAREHGLVPDDPTVATALTSMFVHVGLAHLLGDVVFLWLFGPSVEDAMGRVRFVAFYLAGGLVALFAQVAVDPSSTTPLVGASGAITAVMGGYLRLYPWSRVLTVVFLVFFFTVVEIPVPLMLVLWAGLQIALGLLDPGHAASVAHLAGFAFGLLVIRLLARRVKTPDDLLARGRAAYRASAIPRPRS
jgi:membrane associated rhomboid family serine protease